MSCVPSAGRVARANRTGEGGPLRRPGLLGASGPGLRRSLRTRAHPGPRPGRARRKPNGQDLHGRSVRRFPVRLAVSSRIREPADVRLTRRRAGASRLLHLRGEPVRSARQPTVAGRTRSMPAVPRAGAAGAPLGPRRRRARFLRMGRGAPSVRGAGTPRPPPPSIRSRDRGHGRTLDAAGLLPPEPAEHLHRKAHGGDARPRHDPREEACRAARAGPSTRAGGRRTVGGASRPFGRGRERTSAGVYPWRHGERSRAHVLERR